MSWTVLCALGIILALALLGLLARRSEMRRLAAVLAERGEAKRQGSHAAQLQYPVVDLTRCLGCGTCVRECPEEGVLGLVHGQAAVIHGARCVGHGLCVEACPMDAVQVTLGDLKSRTDIPVLSEQLEVEGSPGLYLAGEVTGYALVRTAITHGAAVATHVAQRVGAGTAARVQRSALRPARGSRHGEGGPATAVLEASAEEPLDLCIVGAGPAGLSCSLAAKEQGLNVLTLEREEIGGTVSKYPRRKLVMTQPVELPLHGRLKKTSYFKEELIRLWEDVAEEHDLPIRREEFVDVERGEDGVFTVQTKVRSYRAHNVCLCLGRRGTPRKLGVPGEELPKVTYSLLDAESYQGRRILVVGGGDSAIEAAIGLAIQPGNRVWLSYRKASFFRIKAKNRKNLEQMTQEGRIVQLLESQVREIREDRVLLTVRDPNSERGSGVMKLKNDEVFVFAGGIPPFEQLESCGVSFDGSLRPEVVEVGEKGTGILRALVWGLALTVLTVGWCYLLRDYYSLPWSERPDSGLHTLLEPTSGIGLTTGILASVLIVLNLVYLIRRSRVGKWIAGSLQYWLSIHVVTGILALLLLIVHSSMGVQNTSGGHAFIGVVILVITGGIGRYFYSYLPKAANGRTLAREEARDALTATVADLDREGRGLGADLQQELDALALHGSWGSSLSQRVRGLFTSRSDLRRSLVRIEEKARRQGVAQDQIARTLGLARKLHRSSLLSAHYEDLRGVLSSWRFVHRWIALAMLALAAIHIANALRYARFW